VTAGVGRAGPSQPRARGASGHGDVVCGDARQLPALVDPSAHGLCGLVLTSPPYGPSVHGQVTTRPGAGIRKAHWRYSTDPANLAHVGLDRLLAAMRDVLTGSARLRPGGFVVMTVRPYWRAGELVDLPGRLARLGEQVGLVLYERNVALLCGLRGEDVVPRVSFFALDQVRRARAGRLPRQVVAHEDLLVWRRG
jgi:modification methylase